MGNHGSEGSIADLGSTTITIVTQEETLKSRVQVLSQYCVWKPQTYIKLVTCKHIEK